MQTLVLAVPKALLPKELPSRGHYSQYFLLSCLKVSQRECIGRKGSNALHVQSIHSARISAALEPRRGVIRFLDLPQSLMAVSLP